MLKMYHHFLLDGQCAIRGGYKMMFLMALPDMNMIERHVFSYRNQEIIHVMKEHQKHRAVESYQGRSHMAILARSFCTQTGT